MTMLFVNTLKAPFITHLLGSASKSFSNIIMNGEMIENAIRSGKIEAGEGSRRSASKKKENEANNTSSYSKTITVNQSGKMDVNQELYQNLFNAHVVAPHHLKPLQPPYPKWYDANAQCDYHAGIVGHSIEHCTAFKKLVERLISMGMVKLDDSPSTENPLPNHDNNGVNMVGRTTGRRIKEDISEVKIPLRWVWKNMVRKGLIVSSSEKSFEMMENYCEFHHEEGHEIQECTEFKALVQDLMDNKEMEFYGEVKEEGSICTSESSKVPKVVQPVVIISRPKKEEMRTPAMPKIIIKKPATFPYQDSKKVPWNYECNTTVPGKETAKSQCVSTNPESMKEATLGEQKRKVVEPVKEEEAVEFLKFLKHSEYNVVEQLHKQLARIFVLSLLLNSEIHRNTLMKMLNENYVSKDISVSKLDRLVNNISADNFIFFNDDEIPSRGMGSTKALHITARCKGRILPGVLIDNGSALNVLPLFTLNRLPIDSSHMKTCQNVVRAFDGRPWIHSAGAVPSSLHQMLKLVSDGRLVTIKAEEDIIVAVSNEMPYVETNDESVECSFRSLEFVNAAFVPEGSKILTPKLSKTTEMGLQLLVGKGALPGRGLGRYLQGKTEVPVLKEKQDNFGLGYKPDRGQRRNEIEKRQERRRARLNREEAKWEPMIIPHISKTFISGGVIHQESIEETLGNMHINAIYEHENEERSWLDIRPYEPGSVSVYQ
ncbi:uncharacterized protein [Gossypium hirsutum]|uniref:G-patch domain-containing protein n=1 Tax=Gossypium hirsutum TaxID=3635 RepID=A0ABM3AMP1_GOSHI|nr:uncharacterized protein LOC121220333 [Gossypium hirsutum]